MSTYRGKPIKEMSRQELEDAVIFLKELNRKLVQAAESSELASHG